MRVPNDPYTYTRCTVENSPSRQPIAAALIALVIPVLLRRTLNRADSCCRRDSFQPSIRHWIVRPARITRIAPRLTDSHRTGLLPLSVPRLTFTELQRLFYPINCVTSINRLSLETRWFTISDCLPSRRWNTNDPRNR